MTVASAEPLPPEAAAEWAAILGSGPLVPEVRPPARAKAKRRSWWDWLLGREAAVTGAGAGPRRPRFNSVRFGQVRAGGGDPLTGTSLRRPKAVSFVEP